MYTVWGYEDEGTLGKNLGKYNSFWRALLRAYRHYFKFQSVCISDAWGKTWKLR